MESKRLAFLPVAIVTAALDLVAKLHTTSVLDVGARVRLVGEWLSWTHVPAMGGAFGVFQDWLPGAQLIGFALLAILTSAVVIWFYHGLAPGEHGSAAGLGALLGGIAGHTIDRLRYGSGIDIVHLGPIDSNLIPDFSLADVAIVLGVVTLIVELLATEMATRAAERPKVS